LPLQFAQFGEHESMWQVPLWHDSEAKYWQQACPHVPQLLASLDRLTQTPLQAVSPLLHSQLPLLQTMFGPHACPQLPQLLGSVMVSTQAPPQSTSPLAHCDEHRPCEQTSPEAHA
jgi:hypothetical protein